MLEVVAEAAYYYYYVLNKTNTYAGSKNFQPFAML
jgi:hypothetical protein